MMVVGISQKIKRAWLDVALDRISQDTKEKELRSLLDSHLREELPGKESRAKASGIVLRIWSGVDVQNIEIRHRALALLPRISGQERIWLHWGMTALAYPFFRDVAEIVGRMLTLQDDISTAQVQSRLTATWGDRNTSKEAAQKLITSLVDWEVLRGTSAKGHFLLARKMTTAVTDLQLWLIEAMLAASASDEIEAQQLLRLPELFPFSVTVSVGDLRKHEGFNIHRQGLDMDMVGVRYVKAEPLPKPPRKEKPNKKEPPKPEQPTFFDEPIQQVESDPASSVIASFSTGFGPERYQLAGQQQEPYRALVLVRNLSSATDRLDFGEFVLTSIGHPQHLELRERLSSLDVFVGDWILEKTYSKLPPCLGSAPSGLGGIPNDIEDILFMLRLFKVGDVAFVRQAVIKPNGETLAQYPYRMMNALNGNSILTTELKDDDGKGWPAFADGLRTSQSWDAKWFSVSRRFFLYGSANGFNPDWGEVDRVVDYATALEAALVPEGDFSRSRCANRAATLCSIAPDEQRTVASLVKKLYDIRSSIVHGSLLTEERRDWLKQNSREIERRVRQVLVAAVQQAPPDDDGRAAFLRNLFDVIDAKRGEYVLQVFQKIETEEVRKTTAAQITKLQAKRK
jgi:hypothetical protein